MKHKHYITPYMVFATLIILVLGLTACGSGSKNNTPGKITGQAIKGPISGGTVTAYAVASGSKGSVLGTAQTDANGNYSISSGSYSGPVFLEIHGGYYTDEATGTLVNLPTTAGSGLQAVVDNVSAGSTVQSQITPLTTMAVARAQNMPGGLTASNINASNQSIGTYFGGIDILNTQPINPLVSGSASGASQSAISYGLILAGLSQQVETLGLSNPFDLFTALAQDISDGTFDGESGSTAVNLGGSPMDPTTGTSFLATAINTFSYDTTINASGGTVPETLIILLQNSADTPSDQSGSISLSWTSICTDYGITTISVNVVTSSGAEVAAGNWSCSAHEGTITDVPAGAGYTIRIIGTVTGGTIAWRGEKSGVGVTAGETTPAGAITMAYTGNDTTLPVITSTTPSIDATGVPVTTMITAIFSEKMAASSINDSTFTLLKKGATSVSGSVVYDAASLRAVFLPSGNLSYASTYTATLTTDIEDMAGNKMESVLEWSFTTEDQPPTDTVPAAPAGLIAASGNGQVTITWDAVPAATSYNVYWSETSGVSKTTGEKISDITNNSYTHTSLTNGTTYYYIVTSINSDGESNESSEISSAPGSIDGAPPTGSVAINNDAVYTASADVTLSLSSSSTRGISQMCISNTTTCSSWESYTTSKLWTLTTGDGLKFVYAWFKDSSGTSNADPYFSVITLDTTPPTDGTLTATAGDAQVLLNWSGFSDVTSGIGSYRLVYSTSGTPDSCSSGSNIYSGSETSYTHTGLTNGTTYYYRVCATDNAENASIGSMATFTPGYWVRQIGSVKKDVSRGIAVDSDGNSYITGYTEGYLFGVGIEKGYDMFVVKFDANGSFDVIKEGFYNAKGENEFGMDIDVNSDSPSLVISGYKEDSEGDLWAMTEYNLPGSVVPFPFPSGFTTHSIGSVGYSVALDPHSGGYYFTGSIIYEAMVANYQVYFGGKDIYINKQHFPDYFSRRIGTALDDAGYGIAVDSGGNSYITGYTEGDLAGSGHVGGQDIFVVKYDTDGILRWIRQIGTTLDDVGYGIAVDSEGNSYIAGYTEGNLAGSGNDGGQDIFVAKFDTKGTQQWIRQIGTAFDDVGYGIAVDSEGNSYVTGSTGGDLSGSGHAGGQDIFVVKYDTNGTLQLMRQIGTAFDDVSYAIAVDLNGTCHITGYTDGDLDGKGNIGESDIFIMRFYGI